MPIGQKGTARIPCDQNGQKDPKGPPKQPQNIFFIRACLKTDNGLFVLPKIPCSIHILLSANGKCSEDDLKQLMQSKGVLGRSQNQLKQTILNGLEYGPAREALIERLQNNNIFFVSSQVN